VNDVKDVLLEYAYILVPMLLSFIRLCWRETKGSWED
jgi:hypothetical protein